MIWQERRQKFVNGSMLQSPAFVVAHDNEVENKADDVSLKESQ
jgi:hypothetical protein